MYQHQVSFNVAVKVAPSIDLEFVEWMSQEHVPEVIATGLFIGARFYEVLDIDNEDGKTYSIQYLLENEENYQDYLTNFAGALREKTQKKFGDQVLAFRSHLRLLKEFLPQN